MGKIQRFLEFPLLYKKYMIWKILVNPIVRGSFGALGKGSFIGKPLYISGKKYIFIGSDVGIDAGARIEAILKYHKDNGDIEFRPRLEIGNRVSIGQNIHMTCAKSVIIEDDVVISSNVLITDNNHSYKKIDTHPLQQELEILPVKIGRYSFIGAGARVLPGVQIGRNVIVGANAVVTKDIPDYTIAVGIPARVIKRYDEENRMWVRTET